MFSRRPFRVLQCRSWLPLLLLLAAVPRAQAQMAVLDAASVGQLVMQAGTLSQQLMVLRSNLQAVTGGRGMDLLLSGQQRNYLPADYASLSTVNPGSSSYGALGSDLAAAVRAVTVLSGNQLGGLSPAGSQQVAAQRQSVALIQAITRVALSNSSSRFAALQQLIDAIGRTQDSKASLDLQARIAAEQGMLQNEQTKLQVLYQGAVAQRWADQQRTREQVIAGHGSFAARFQPAP
jgi:type IV secretion system protein VirB5